MRRSGAAAADAAGTILTVRSASIHVRGRGPRDILPIWVKATKLEPARYIDNAEAPSHRGLRNRCDARYEHLVLATPPVTINPRLRTPLRPVRDFNRTQVRQVRIYGGSASVPPIVPESSRSPSQTSAAIRDAGNDNLRAMESEPYGASRPFISYKWTDRR